MSTTEELGLRVTLSGNQPAAAGLNGVAAAEDKVAEGAKRSTTSVKENTEAIEKRTKSTRAAAEADRGFTEQLQRAAAGLNSFGVAGDMVQSMLLRLRGGALLVTAAFAGMYATHAFGQMQDDARVTLARIQGITGSLTEARSVYRGLGDDAIRLRATQDATLQGFTRIAGAVLELGGTSRQARQINEIVLATAKASGIAQDEAANAARQFAQALGSGVLQGDELRSIMENNQELSRQLAKGLGVSVSELRKLGEEGRLTADVVANALLSRLPEIRSKLAEVPLTAADAWTKLSTVLSQWVFAGDQVEMKAGLIARAMNAIADGIDRSRKAATQPIVVEVRTVNVSEGGAAFVGPNQGRRDPAKILQEQEAAIAASIERRGNALVAMRASDNEIIAGARLGLEQAGKASIKEFEKYADGLGLASERLQKDFDKHVKTLRDQKVKLQTAMAGGDPRTLEIARQQLAQIEALELKATTDVARKIAEAKKSEAAKAGADAKKSGELAYAETIAREEGLQRTLAASLSRQNETLKLERERGVLTEVQYHLRLDSVDTQAIERQEASVKRQLDAARAAGKTRVADVQKFEGELAALDEKRIKRAQQTEAATEKISREAMAREIEATRRHNDVLLSMMDTLADLREQFAIERADREFELALIGQTEQSQQRMQVLRQIELAERRALTQAYREYIRALNAAETTQQEVDITNRYNEQQRAIRGNAIAQRELAVQVVNTRSAYDTLSTAVDGFIDASLRGFGSLKDWLKNQFFEYLKKEVIKPLIMNILVSATGSVSGGAGGVAGGVLNGVLGNILGPGGLLGGGGGLLGLGSMSGVMGFGAGAGILGGIGAGANLMLTGLMGGGLSGMIGGIGMAAQAGIMPLIGALGPIALALGGIYMLARKFDGANGTAVRYAWGNDYQSNSRPQERNTFMTTFGRLGLDGDAADAVRPFAEGMIKLEDMIARFMTSSQIALATATIGQGTSRWIGYDGDPTKAIGQMTKDMLQQRFGAIFGALDFKNITAAIKNFKGDTDALAKYIGSVAAVMQVLSNQASVYKGIIGETITADQLEALRTESETLDQTLTRVVTVFSATNVVAELMGKDVANAFGKVGLASLEARQNLVDLAGGVEQLGQMTSYFYEHYYSEAERAERSLSAANAAVTTGFAELNMAVPTSREQFRQLVEAQDLSTEAGRRTWTALMRLAPAFDLITAKADGMLTVITRGGNDPYARSTGQATVTGLTRSEEYLNNFFSEAERHAMQLAASTRVVNDTFNVLGLTVPRTRAEFRALVEGLDLTTENGQRAYRMLMAIVPQFMDFTDALEDFSNRITGINLGQVYEAGGQLAEQRLQQLFAIIDSTGEALNVKLQRKIAAAGALAAELDAQYRAALAANGNVSNATTEALRYARDQVLAQQAALAGNLALFTTLQAQYGGFAEQMYELEMWRQAQIAAANGNAATLLLIEQSYQERRNAILNGGVASGLSSLAATLRQWLNNLLLNTQLTTLSPAQQLAEARSQYEAALASGDASAITQAADAYLRIAREYFASGAGYDAIFAAVRAQVQALINGSTYVPSTPAPTSPSAPPPPSGANDGGNASGLVAQARASASRAESARALTDDTLARVMAAVKYAIDREGEANRENRDESTRQIVDALSAPGSQRMKV